MQRENPWELVVGPEDEQRELLRHVRRSATAESRRNAELLEARGWTEEDFANLNGDRSLRDGIRNSLLQSFPLREGKFYRQGGIRRNEIEAATTELEWAALLREAVAGRMPKPASGET